MNLQQSLDSPPVIAHVIHRLAVGGLENGLVNLINNMPETDFKHVIICMDTYTEFRNRITRPDVECYAMHKKPGQDISMYFKLWKLLRRIKPQIVHTRNIGTLECTIPAFFAGVPVRIHGEHGRDMTDIDGSNRKYIFLRKILKPLVRQYIAMSRDLENWLIESIHVKKDKVAQLYNGVDLRKFRPVGPREVPLPVAWYGEGNPLVLGTVGRLQGEKDQKTLVEAFIRLVEQKPQLKKEIRLALIGDGPLRNEIEARIREAGVLDLVWFAGSRDDVATLIQGLDVFILPSLGEGISNTILEAMASGLPVIATNVGGNPELVKDGETGLLVEPGNSKELAAAISRYLDDRELIIKHGTAARERVENTFSLEKMVDSYTEIYKGVLARSVKNLTVAE